MPNLTVIWGPNSVDFCSQISCQSSAVRVVVKLKFVDHEEEEEEEEEEDYDHGIGLIMCLMELVSHMGSTVQDPDMT
jgi:hypothetical protein